MKFKVKITVFQKKDVLDPKGETLSSLLKRLNFDKNPVCSVGKYFELELNAKNKEDLDKKLKTICLDVLSNPLIDDYEILSAMEIK